MANRWGTTRLVPGNTRGGGGRVKKTVDEESGGVRKGESKRRGKPGRTKIKGVETKECNQKNSEGRGGDGARQKNLITRNPSSSLPRCDAMTHFDR